MYYKLEQACVTNWGSFVLLQIRANVVTNWGSFIITNWGKCCYKLALLLQIRATVIGAKLITIWGRYYKLEQLLQIWDNSYLCRKVSSLSNIVTLLFNRSK